MPNPENPSHFFDPEAEADPETLFLEKLSLGEKIKWAQANNRHLVIDGDWGGQVLATIPAQEIKCSAATLSRLAAELNKTAWHEDESGTEGLDIYLSSREDEIHATIAGGMGGGQLRDRIWLHPEFVDNEQSPNADPGLYEKIKLVLDARAKNLAEADKIYRENLDREIKDFFKKNPPPKK